MQVSYHRNDSAPGTFVESSTTIVLYNSFTHSIMDEELFALVNIHCRISCWNIYVQGFPEYITFIITKYFTSVSSQCCETFICEIKGLVLHVVLDMSAYNHSMTAKC